MDLQLNDKTAFVSGSSQGIGFAIANTLATEGAHVIINGRDDTKLRITKDKILAQHPHAKVSTFCADLCQAEATEELVAQYPSIDILVNSLGIFEPKDFLDIPDEDWQRFLTSTSSPALGSAVPTCLLCDKKTGAVFCLSVAKAPYRYL